MLQPALQITDRPFAQPGLLGELRLRQSLGVAVPLQRIAELCTAVHVDQPSLPPLFSPDTGLARRVEVYHCLVLVSVGTRVPRRVAGCVSPRRVEAKLGHIR